MHFIQVLRIKWLLKSRLFQAGVACITSFTAITPSMARKSTPTPVWSFVIETDQMTGDHYCKAQYPVGRSFLEIFPQKNIAGGKAMIGASIQSVPGIFEILRWKFDNGPVRYAPSFGILFDYQDVGRSGGIDTLAAADRIKIEYYDDNHRDPNPKLLDFRLMDFDKALNWMRSPRCQN